MDFELKSEKAEKKKSSKFKFGIMNTKNKSFCDAVELLEITLFKLAVPNGRIVSLPIQSWY